VTRAWGYPYCCGIQLGKCAHAGPVSDLYYVIHQTAIFQQGFSSCLVVASSVSLSMTTADGSTARGPLWQCKDDGNWCDYNHFDSSVLEHAWTTMQECAENPNWPNHKFYLPLGRPGGLAWLEGCTPFQYTVSSGTRRSIRRIMVLAE
jgi:hypothetical protein